MAADEPETDSVQAGAPAAPQAKEYVPKPPPLVRCKECDTLFYKTRHDQEFHAPKCRRDFHRRKEIRGAKLLEFAMEWRRKRRKGGFTELTQMVDGFLAEDRERAERRKRGTKP